MTGLTSNIDQVIQHFQKMANQTKEIDVSQALLAGVNAAAGQMKFRIFNEGKDAEGNSLGQYKGRKKTFSPKQQLSADFKKKLSNSRLLGPENQTGDSFNFSEYELIRLRDGRQIRYKDLELTGSLRRGIVPADQNDTSGVVSKTKVVCAIPNTDLFNIARYQEQQIGKIRGTDSVRIFSQSAQEKQTMTEVITETVKQLYDRVFNS